MIPTRTLVGFLASQLSRSSLPTCCCCAQWTSHRMRFRRDLVAHPGLSAGDGLKESLTSFDQSIKGVLLASNGGKPLKWKQN